MEENTIQSGTTINVDASAKKHHTSEKYYIQNPSTCSSGKRKYLASINDNSVIMC